LGAAGGAPGGHRAVGAKDGQRPAGCA
jgi:hypothetical protein